MKKTVLILLAGMLALSAVEWDVEQVSSSYHYNDRPVITLDNLGKVGTAYIAGTMDDAFLMYASNATGSWVEQELILLYGCYSLDYDSEGNAFIVYSNNEVDWGSPMDIYLATDTSGEFTITNLTNAPADRDDPLIRLDAEDNVHILYHQSVGENDVQLFYGWIDGGEFYSEQVTDNLDQSYYWSRDIVVDENNVPHVFYKSEGASELWHAVRSSLSASPDWSAEKIHEEQYLPIWEISATADGSDFHITYCEVVSYGSNQSGSWTGEQLSDTLSGEYPSIAVDPKGNPHIVWLSYDEEGTWIDLYYAGKTTTDWSWEPLTSTPTKEESPAQGHYFAIDAQGYGHIVYADWVYGEEDDTGYVYHAKSTEPLTGSSIAERPAASNPFNLEVHGSSVHFSLPEQGSISVNLYDACGRRVQCVAAGTFTAGEHAVPINTTGLSSGVYFIRAEIAERSANAKFVLTR